MSILQPVSEHMFDRRGRVRHMTIANKAQDPPRRKVLADGFAFAECLRWRGDRLFFSDLHAHQVISLDVAGNKRIECECPGRPGGLGWLPSGELLIVAITERKLYRLEEGELRLHADLSDQIPYLLNDMSVDTRGYAYVGNIGFDYYGGGTPKPATL
jgi:sugar lactone lactonase YvrE